MICDNCFYDPVRDLAPVDQFGFIELKNALESSVVPSQMPGSETDYNGIDDPEKILGTPRDVFEAIEAQKAYEAALASSASSQAESGEDS